MTKKIKTHRKPPKFKKANSLNLFLERERSRRYRKSIDPKKLIKERDDLVDDLHKYRSYAGARILTLNVLKKYLEDHPEKTEGDNNKANEFIEKLTTIATDFNNARDICKKMDIDNPEDMLEAVSVLSSTVVERLMDLQHMEEDYKNLVKPYAENLQAVIENLNKGQIEEIKPKLETVNIDTLNSNEDDDIINKEEVEVIQDEGEPKSESETTEETNSTEVQPSRTDQDTTRVQ